MSEFSHNRAVIIGINQYQSGISPLSTAVNDAKELNEILRLEHGYQAWTLLDEEATLKNITRLLTETLPQEVTADDRLVFYFAGHGIALNGEEGPEGYLIPQDAKLGDTNSYLPMTQLQSALINLPCRHFLGLLDCCFAGAFRWSSTRDIGVVPEVIHQERYYRFITDPAWQVITSAASDQKAADAFNFNTERGQRGNHSPFAAALIEALAGKADAYPPSTNGQPPGDGVITATELYLYLRDAVETATEGNRQGQTPGIWPLKRHDKGEYIFLSPGHPLNLPPAPTLDASKNPYRGLESFDEEHSKLFFGRTELVEKLQKFVKTHPLTVVLGASGSGKSSLVKAGLIPQLRQEKTEKWSILPPIRPGETPFQALNNALKNAQLPEVAVQNPQQNLAMSIDVWAKDNPNSKLLLFIDQSEEIITLCQNEDERKEFFQQILTAIDAHRDKLRVVLSLRSDFEPQVRDAGFKFIPKGYSVKNTELKNRWQRGRFIVPAMTRGELRDAIEKPAEARVMYFQPHELVERLVDEVADMPGALPLLSFGLSELYLKYLKRQWEAENAGDTIDRALTQSDYQDLGGVIQSLTQRADEEYETLVKEDEAYAKIIRLVMLRMVAIGGGELARRRVPLSELEYPLEENALVKEVIERFTKARLLVTGEDAEGKPYVEPAHDVLVRGWQKLLAWKQEDEEGLLLQRRLTPAATEWESVKQKEKPSIFQAKGELVINGLDQGLYKVESLLNKIPAQIARLWRRSQNQQERSKEKNSQFLWNSNPYLDVLDQELKSDDNWFNQVEAEFVQESVLQKRKNISWRLRIAIAVILGLSGLTILAVYNANVAERRRINADIRAFSLSSKSLLDSNQQLEANIDAIKAGRLLEDNEKIDIEPETQMQAITALQRVVYTQRLPIQTELPNFREINRLEGHNSGVRAINFSNNGSLIASGSEDNTIKIWKRDGTLLNTFTGHTKTVRSIGFSPDDQILVSASDDKTLKLWDIENKTLLRTFEGHTGTIPTVSFSPNSQLIASASADGTIKIWNSETGLIKTIDNAHDVVRDGPYVQSVQFSPDGQSLASGGYDGLIKLWKIDGTLINSFQHGYIVWDVSFSPDGQTIASAGADKQIKLWSRDGTLLKTLKGHLSSVRRVDFSFDGETLASASEDNTVKIWSKDGTLQFTSLKGHSGWVWDVAFSPNHSEAQVLASASRDGTIKLWRQEETALKRLDVDFVPDFIRFSPDGTTIAIGNWEGTVLWNLENNQVRNLETGPTDNISFSLDGKILAIAGSYSKTVKLWNLTTHDSKILGGHKEHVSSVLFNPHQKLLASGSWDRTVKLWNFDNLNGTINKSCANEGNKGEEGYVSSLSFSPDGKLLAFGSWDGTVKLWPWNLECQAIETVITHGDRVQDISFSPDGKMIASASSDNTIKLWTLGETDSRTLRGHNAWVLSLSFHPNGKILATGSSDQTVKLWGIDSGSEIETLKSHKPVEGLGMWPKVSFNPDGKILASTSPGDKTIVLWNFDLNDLLVQACGVVGDYLKTNPNVVNQDDQQLCQ